MRKRILHFCFLFFGTWLFSVGVSLAAGPTAVPQYIRQPTVWTKENSPYIVNSHVYVQAKLEIGPGTVVKFSQSPYALYINAEFSARGTKNEKIVFTSIHDDSDGTDSDKDAGPRPPQASDWEGIKINPNFKIEFSSAVIRYGRVGVWATSSGTEYKNLSIRNCEISHALTGIYMENLEPVIEGNIISENSTGILAIIKSGFDRLTTVSGNSFLKNTQNGVSGSNAAGSGKYAVDARGSWWGDASGPKDAVANPSGKGDKVSSSYVLYNPWLGKDPNDGPDPVIIIPGIMGSWKKDGVWKIDPIFHTYDNLIEAFIAAGYVNDGKSMSVFPYEWRDSNVENAKLLHKRIQQIKTDSGRPKVDIVAHSMGGLLAREYIESDYYDNDVDQLITVGTPHLGAPKDYVTWEGGEFLGLWAPLQKRIVALEALENGYLDIFDYIHKRPMKSVEELLPVYNYLYDDSDGDYVLRDSYPENYPRNEFLESLNSVGRLNALKNVEFTKIIGKMSSDTNTVSSYNVVKYNTLDHWEHGYPKYFSIPALSRLGITKGKGDETVPLYSAEAPNIPTDRKIFFPSRHDDLPTDTQKDILEILTGTKPASEVTKWHAPSVLSIFIHSPIDIQIVSPSGKRLGKNFETGGVYDEIEGAYYTGFDTNTEFLTIPNPEDGEYKILTEGTAAGEYKIEITRIVQDEKSGETEESIQTIMGEASPKVQEEKKFEIEGKKVKKLILSKEEKKGESKNPNASVHRENIKNDFLEIEDEENSSPRQSRIQKVSVLKSDIRQYFKSGEIKKRKEAGLITKRLSHIRVYLKRYEMGTSLRKIKISKTKANREINRIISHLRKKTTKAISEEAKNDLVERLNGLRID